MKEKAKEEADFLINVWKYAMENGYDRKKAVDLQKILKILNSEDTSIEYAELVVPMMDILDRMVISEVEYMKAKRSKTKKLHK